MWTCLKNVCMCKNNFVRECEHVCYVCLLILLIKLILNVLITFQSVGMIFTYFLTVLQFAAAFAPTTSCGKRCNLATVLS